MMSASSLTTSCMLIASLLAISASRSIAANDFAPATANMRILDRFDVGRQVHVRSLAVDASGVIEKEPPRLACTEGSRR